MKILFDHCVPRPLRNSFPDHSISTTAQMGWENLQNGLLLAEAASAFDVVLTVDTGMKFQQNLKALPIAVVILNSIRNTPEALMPFATFVEAVLPTLQIGQMVEIDASGKISLIASGRPRPA